MYFKEKVFTFMCMYLRLVIHICYVTFGFISRLYIFQYFMRIESKLAHAWITANCWYCSN